MKVKLKQVSRIWQDSKLKPKGGDGQDAGRMQTGYCIIHVARFRLFFHFFRFAFFFSSNYPRT